MPLDELNMASEVGSFFFQWGCSPLLPISWGYHCFIAINLKSLGHLVDQDFTNESCCPVRWQDGGWLRGLITGEGFTAADVAVSEWLPNNAYLLPLAVDQRELQVIVLYGFIRPEQGKDNTLMAFLWFTAGGVLIAWGHVDSSSSITTLPRWTQDYVDKKLA